jgi:transcriptional regulator with XRE-family HTH domain
MARGRLRGFDPTRLRTARIALGMTQEQLAIRTGVTRSVITSWESGKNAPDPRRAKVLAELLGTTIADLTALKESDMRPTDYRMWRGLTREGLSDLTGIGINPLAEIERYARQPSSDLVRRIAEALSVDPRTYTAAWDRGRRAVEAGDL